jgi:hypothetical protein
MPKRPIKPNKEYTLPESSGLLDTTKRVLALDPGSRNCGISVVACNDSKKVKIVANALVTKPISDLVSYGAMRNAFLEEIDRWIDVFKPNGIVVERFQTRGNSGPLIEYVGVMIGLLGGYRMPIKAITASTWKNDFHRRFDPLTLDSLYNECAITPHQLDSCFIGIYGLEKGIGSRLDFDPVKIAIQAENTSRLPPKRKRN